MKSNSHIRMVLSTLAFLLVIPNISFADCTQTLSVGANIASAVSAAANGSTICLNSGDYGSVAFTNISRSALVTLKSVTGVGAAMSPTVTSSKYIRFESMTLRNMSIKSCSSNIQVASNTWAQDTAGISVFDYGYGCPATNKQILIDGNNFTNTRPAWSEGRIGLVEVNGVTISNNLIMGQSTGNGADGIQTGGSLANIVVGPGNIFRNIKQAPCDSTPGVPHCDSIQFVGDCPTCTINGNWFDNVEVVLQHHDATVPVVFTNNLVTNATQMWAYSNPGSASNSRIEHNTFYNLGLAMWGTNGSGVSDTTGLVGKNNILINTQPSTCSSPSCSFTYNLCQNSSQCSFNTANTITGTPTFVGGAAASITTWAGWQLASTSLGYKKGSDGLDVGTNYYGTSTSSSGLAAPTNLRLVSSTYNQLQLQFDNSNTTQTGFIINRKTGSTGTYAQVGTITTTSFADSNVVASTQYCYTVQASNSTSSSPVSNELCASTASAPAAAPTIASFTATPASITSGQSSTLSFSATGATTLVITPGSLAVTGTTSKVVTPTATTTYTLTATNSSGSATKTVTVTVTAAATTVSGEKLFTTQVPATLNNTDGAGVNYELGMKFTASVAGKIKAIRFYKSASETGTHTGKIYSSTGSLLASVTFAGETASGWQEQALASAVTIAANTTYVVSVNTGNTYYVTTVSGLASQVVNGNLKSVVGSNGVYGSVGAMPTSSYQNSNYFRDVVFAANADTTPPTISITAPTASSSNSGSVNVTATAADNVGVAGVQFKINGVNLGSELTAAPYAVTLDTTKYTNGSYTISAVARDAAANTTTAQVTITINNPVVVTESLFSTQTPSTLNNTDGAGVNYELGMKFTTTAAGQIKSIKFYKSSSETGTHTGKIYSSTGILLASVTFTNETASGWQTQALATPLTIAANTTYVVSVNTGNSYYVATASGMASQISSTYIKSVVGNNGVYGNVGVMPNSSYQNTNYFRDIVFSTTK
jgi:hypothetical protein